MVYNWKQGARVKDLDAQQVGERFHLLEVGPGLTPQTVLEDARDPESPTHPDIFRLDDTEAVESYRLERAAYLLRSIVTIVTVEGDGERELRAFTPVTVHETDQHQYLSIVTVLSDADYRRQSVQTALSEMLALKRKYADLEEFAGVFAAIEEASKTLV